MSDAPVGSRIRVYSYLGILVSEQQILTSRQLMDLSSLGAGLFFIEIGTTWEELLLL